MMIKSFFHLFFLLPVVYHINTSYHLPHYLLIEKHPTANFSLRSEEVIFDTWLDPVTSKDSIKQFKKQIDSLHKSFSHSKSLAFYKATDNWELIGFRNSGWVENFPGKRRPIDDNFIRNKKAYAVTGTFILEAFKLNTNILPLDFIPFVHDRGGAYNSVTTAILPVENYLLIRHVHSYPNGNQTSWYRESVYYFRKAAK